MFIKNIIAKVIILFLIKTTHCDKYFEPALEDTADIDSHILSALEMIHNSSKQAYYNEKRQNVTFDELFQENLNLNISKLTPMMREEALTRSTWTSCAEFLNTTVFDATRVVKTAWKMYLAWTNDFELGKNPTLAFSFPTQTVLWQFAEEFNKKIAGIRWNTSELFVETNFDFNMLFFRTNISGWYAVITSYNNIDEFTSQFVKVDVRSVALKFFENGHLGVLNCVERLLFIFAPIEQFPNTNTEVDEAKKFIKFRTDLPAQTYLSDAWKRKYTLENPPPPPPSDLRQAIKSHADQRPNPGFDSREMPQGIFE